MKKKIILADAHVHIYSCFELTQLFNAAFRNFEQVATKINLNISYAAVLLLSETSKDNYFDYLSNRAKNNLQLSLELKIETTQEDCSLIVHNAKGQILYLVAGRQIVTAEDLEVLALATNQRIEDGKPIITTIEATIEGDGIPVIPWGFGKWIGSRGSILKRLLIDHNFPYLFLGDNSGRPSFWSNPDYFQLAKQLKMQILPGSDPLPFPSEFCRAGSFGFAVNGTVNPETPAQSIKQILLDSSLKPEPYGSLETPWRFIQNQISMQIAKRLRDKQ